MEQFLVFVLKVEKFLTQEHALLQLVFISTLEQSSGKKLKTKDLQHSKMQKADLLKALLHLAMKFVVSKPEPHLALKAKPLTISASRFKKVTETFKHSPSSPKNKTRTLMFAILVTQPKKQNKSFWTISTKPQCITESSTALAQDIAHLLKQKLCALQTKTATKFSLNQKVFEQAKFIFKA